jgi:hypothetical protein
MRIDMSSKEAIRNLHEEISLIHNVITNPAGFVLNAANGQLTICSHFNGVNETTEWEVMWQEISLDMIIDYSETFLNPLEAAFFFVEKRHAMQFGPDLLS